MIKQAGLAHNVHMYYQLYIYSLRALDERGGWNYSRDSGDSWGEGVWEDIPPLEQLVSDRAILREPPLFNRRFSKLFWRHYSKEQRPLSKQHREVLGELCIEYTNFNLSSLTVKLKHNLTQSYYDGRVLMVDIMISGMSTWWLLAF